MKSLFSLRCVIPTASFPQHPVWYPKACEIHNNLPLATMQQKSTVAFSLMPKDSMIDCDCWNTSQTCTQSPLCSQNSLLCEIRAGGLRISWFIVSVEVLSIRPQKAFYSGRLGQFVSSMEYFWQLWYLITMSTTLWCPNKPTEVSYILNACLLNHNSWTTEILKREISIVFFSVTHHFTHRALAQWSATKQCSLLCCYKKQ